MDFGAPKGITTVFCSVLNRRTVLYCILLCYIASQCISLYSAILYCTVLCCIVLYCFVLHHIVLGYVAS